MGATFNTMRFTAAVGDAITGVEISKSDANTAYVTLRAGTNFAPKLAVTKDGGTTWVTHDLSTVAAIGNANIRLVAIDPATPSKIFLRVQIPSGGDGVALSLDGGATFVSPPPIAVPGGVLNAFTRLSSGTLLAAGIDGVRNVIFRSTNGGMTFTEIDAPLVRGLGQRNGVAYAASSDDVNDPNGFALAKSTDDGVTFQPILRFADLQAISSCVKTICADDCNLKVNLGIWDESVCSATAMPKPVDGGSHRRCVHRRQRDHADGKGHRALRLQLRRGGRRRLGPGRRRPRSASRSSCCWRLLARGRSQSYFSSLRSARRRSPIAFS